MGESPENSEADVPLGEVIDGGGIGIRDGVPEDNVSLLVPHATPSPPLSA